MARMPDGVAMRTLIDSYRFWRCRGCGCRGCAPSAIACLSCDGHPMMGPDRGES